MLFRRLSKKKFFRHQNRNKTTFDTLRHLGWSAGMARRMLIVGNEIRVKKLAETAPVTAPTIYAAAYGKRANADGQAILAKALGMEIADLFPEEGHEAVNA